MGADWTKGMFFWMNFKPLSSVLFRTSHCRNVLLLTGTIERSLLIFGKFRITKRNRTISSSGGASGGVSKILEALRNFVDF
jgi:hypothetical protein